MVSAFMQLQARVRAYEFGPFGHMEFERSRTKGVYYLVYHCDTFDVETWKPKTVTYSRSTVQLEWSDAALQHWIEATWRDMWEHEMREHMTRHESRVYQAH